MDQPFNYSSKPLSIQQQMPCGYPFCTGFPHSSVGKESTFNAGDPGLIPGLGRSPGEGIGYPLQYSWASLVAQLAKNPPAMWKTWVRSLGWEDSLEKGKATHSSILAWKIPWTVQSMGSQRVGHDRMTFTHSLFGNIKLNNLKKKWPLHSNVILKLL